MRNARESLRALGAVALALTGACSSAPSSGASFAFQRPELVELACLDLSQGNENATPLPLRCCAPTGAEEPLAPEGLLQTCKDGAVPVLHALVSQSVRGELAAVDLESRRVLDSDQRIPGFTFIDVGGLPTAVVVPERRPLPGQPAPEPKEADGPPWTYIASADEQALRAVATCRFRTGVPCGPELSIGNADLARVALGGAPRDMLLGPDQALWVSLPDLGVLARVQVGTAAEALADAGVAEDGGSAEDAGVADDAGSGEDDKPFLLAADGTAVEAPTYYRVPVGAIPGALPLADDAPAYVAACGLGYVYESRATELPRAPEAVVEGTPSAQPARMRYDALSGLLLVSDRALPVLHVFSLDVDGNLVARGVLPMGAQVRDFAFTAFVPETVDIFSKEPLSSEATDQKRYLYALDDRDGSLMQFVFEANADGATVTPLRAPMRDRFEDRSQMFGVGSVLEVVDTRALSPYTCGEGVTPQQSNETIARQLQRDLDKYKSPISKAEKALAAAIEAKDPAEEIKEKRAALEKLRTEQRRLQSQYEIAVNAGPRNLRGVFLMVVSLAGDVSVFDILDLDVACRARTSCVDEQPENPLRAGNNRLDGTTPSSLAVQRNALRLTAAGKPTIAVSATSSFAPIDCAAEVPDDGSAWEPYVEGLKGTASNNMSNTPIVCVPPDPWNQVDTQWAVEENRELPGLAFANGYVTPVEASDLEADSGDTDAGAGEGSDDAEDLAPLNQMLWVHAPHGTNLCARGAQEGVGDQVVIVGAPLNTPSACPNPVADDRPILKVVRAYSDRLLVRALGRTEGSQPDDEKLSRSARNAKQEYAKNARDEVTKLLECYPELVSFQVRVGEERVDGGMPVSADEEATEVRKVFAVLGSNTGFLSRMTTDDNGRCVLDTTKDARLRARASRGRPFQNTSIAFTIAPNETRSVITIGTNGGRSILAGSVVPVNDYPDALPKSIRWFPLTNDLFVVDSASQGLRRFTLTPFGRDTANYR